MSHQPLALSFQSGHVYSVSYLEVPGHLGAGNVWLDKMRQGNKGTAPCRHGSLCHRDEPLD